MMLFAIDEQRWTRMRVERERWNVTSLPSPGTPGEGQGGGLSNRAYYSNPLPSPPPEYRGREKKPFCAFHNSWLVCVYLCASTASFSSAAPATQPSGATTRPA